MVSMKVARKLEIGGSGSEPKLEMKKSYQNFKVTRTFFYDILGPIEISNLLN